MKNKDNPVNDLKKMKHVLSDLHDFGLFESGVLDQSWICENHKYF